MVFEWSARYVTGFAKIDEQHQLLVEVVNEVFEMLSSQNSENIEKILARLDSYVADHLVLEEAYMTETEYPFHEEHRAAHAQFAKHLATIRANAASTTVVALRAAVLLSDWLKEHLLTEDQRLFDHVRGRPSVRV
jgi:hemerythrin